MRLSWIVLALCLSGCDTMTLTLNPPPPGVGGGGGGGIEPLPALSCPVDFASELERAIEAVPGRLDRDALRVQWRLIDTTANSTGHRELASAVESFERLVERLEARGDLDAPSAERLRGLARCYMG